MKTKNVLVLVAILLISNVSLAQNKLDKLFNETTPDERARYQTERMSDRLPLKQEQWQTVFEINLKYTRKMEQVYNQGGGKLQRLKLMKSVGEQKDAELKLTLDPAQYRKYEQMKDELRESMKERARENR